MRRATAAATFTPVRLGVQDGTEELVGRTRKGRTTYGAARLPMEAFEVHVLP